MLQAWGTCICCMISIELFQSVIFTNWNNLDYEHELIFFSFFLKDQWVKDGKLWFAYVHSFLSIYFCSLESVLVWLLVLWYLTIGK